MTMATAMAQVPVWQIPPEVYQGQTTQFAVDTVPGDYYTWDIYNDSTVNFAVDNGTAVAEGQAIIENGTVYGPSITVTWPEPGVYFYKVTAVNAAGCTNNLKVGRIEILESLPTASLRDTAICIGDDLILTVDLTGHGPWNFTVTDGINSSDFATLTADTVYQFTYTPSPKATNGYWVSEISDIYGTNATPSDTATVVVNPKPDISKIYQYDKP